MKIASVLLFVFLLSCREDFDYTPPAKEKAITTTSTAEILTYDGWLSFGHDSKLTFTSPNGNLGSPLIYSWNYNASYSGGIIGVGRSTIGVDNSGIYFQYKINSAPNPGSTDKIDFTGHKIWSRYGWSNEAVKMDFPAIFNSGIYYSADGLRALNPLSGNTILGCNCYNLNDFWGYWLADPFDNSTAFVFNRMTNGDAPEGIFVGKRNLNDLSVVWRKNLYYTGRPANCENFNLSNSASMAVDEMNLYYGAKYYQFCFPAPSYEPQPFGTTPFPDGIYCWDRVSGTQKWFVPANGEVYLTNGQYLYAAEETIENNDTKLTAYDKISGSVIWSVSIGEGISRSTYNNGYTQYQWRPQPILFNGLVIVPTATKITAYNESGQYQWTFNMISPHTAEWNSGDDGYLLAGAGASNTLVVCENDGVHLVNAVNGQEIWSGKPAGMTYAPINPVVYGNVLYVVESAGDNSFPTGRMFAMSADTFSTNPPPPPPPSNTDTIAPTAPINLQVTNITWNSISLSWSPSTDNVGVVGYKVFRNGSQVGTTTGITYTDGGLAQQTTYLYFVRAYDATGNNSPNSNTIQATTLKKRKGNPHNLLKN